MVGIGARKGARQVGIDAGQTMVVTLPQQKPNVGVPVVELFLK